MLLQYHELLHDREKLLSNVSLLKKENDHLQLKLEKQLKEEINNDLIVPPLPSWEGEKCYDLSQQKIIKEYPKESDDLVGIFDTMDESVFLMIGFRLKNVRKKIKLSFHKACASYTSQL